MAGSVDDGDEISGINVTPLVDIMLVLLIIFMVTTSMITNVDQEGLAIDKPEASSGSTIEGASILIQCDPDGKIAVDAKEVSSDEEIKSAIAAKLAEDPDTQGIVQCDEQSNVGQMVRLIDLLRDAGVKKYAIATKKPQAQG
ncbi:MAG: ExbD/TolR family protein [Nannocystaceae bacterium]|nr:biopolymer transporter ExbD [bacterium]